MLGIILVVELEVVDKQFRQMLYDAETLYFRAVQAFGQFNKGQ